MDLAYPLELNRPNVEAHLAFLRDCGAEQVPLYFMEIGADPRPMAPGPDLDRMLGELDSQLGQIRDCGLRSDVFYLDYRHKPADVAGTDADARAWFETICAACEGHGIRDIGFFPNNPGRTQTDAAWDENQAAGYRALADIAANHGQRICSHINMIAGSRYDRVEDVDDVFERVGRDNWGLLFCFGCIALTGLDLAEAIHHWRDRVFIVHLRDVEGTWQEGSKEMQFGTGRIDLPAAIRALREIGYDGIVHPEHFPSLECELAPADRPVLSNEWERGPITVAWTLGFWRGLLEGR